MPEQKTETPEEKAARLQQELEELRAQGVVSAVPAPKALEFRVSAKQAVSIYGLQHFPVTLYPDQWRRIGERWPDLEAFIEENKSQLSFRRS